EPAADEMLLAAALDSRHRSRDGRRGFWDPGQVRRRLLGGVPHCVVAPPDVTAATERLRSLLRYMDAAGVLGHGGAALPALERAADESRLAAALDSRHRSRDGRLGFWDPGQVRRLLLEWIPHYVVAPPDVTAATESLRTLLRYMAAAGLLDPRGAALPELERAVTEAAAEYPAAVADELRWGVAKYWAQKAFDAGVDLTDPKALDRFQRDVDAGRVPYDQDTLDKLFVARMTGAGPDEERAFSQPPVALPPASELAEAAARSQVVRQLTALAEWAGAEGRPLTGTGALRLADARELA